MVSFLADKSPSKLKPREVERICNLTVKKKKKKRKKKQWLVKRQPDKLIHKRCTRPYIFTESLGQYFIFYVTAILNVFSDFAP